MSSIMILAIFIGIIVLIGLGGVLFYLKRTIDKIGEQKGGDQTLGIIKQDLEAMRKKFEKGYSQMANQLGKVQEIGHAMKDFQDFLKSPKLRGNVGEQVLKDLLQQVLPQKNFEIQYQFKEGQRVDAIIKTDQGIIPIDSKFPIESLRRLENAPEDKKKKAEGQFIRDIKKHIDQISKKYIMPQEGTLDFALMYLPSEPVYYEITLNQPQILDYGYRKKVYFVSPNSFFYFLKIIMIGLQGAKIEEASKRILQGLKDVQQESMRFGEELNKMITHIDHAKSSSNRAQKKYKRLRGKIKEVSSLEPPEEKKKLE